MHMNLICINLHAHKDSIRAVAPSHSRPGDRQARLRSEREPESASWLARVLSLLSRRPSPRCPLRNDNYLHLTPPTSPSRPHRPRALPPPHPTKEPPHRPLVFLPMVLADLGRRLNAAINSLSPSSTIDDAVRRASLSLPFLSSRPTLTPHI
jgi:hypothetical protein